MNKLVVAIDFNNFFFQSYYGEKLYNSKGKNINAVKTFFFKLKNIKDSLNPDYFVLCNDLSRERTFRRKLYKGYKANRKPKDDDAVYQMRCVEQLCSLLGFPFINREEYEADDIMGMISKYCTEHDMDCILVSSDRDLYQLAGERVYIYSPRLKEYINDGWLMENYGVTPDEWIELKILQGDRSDNIPGIQGIGEVSALRLIKEYKTIDEIYNHLGYLKPKLKQLLLDGKEIIPLTRQLVTIVKDYNRIQLSEDSLKRLEVFKHEAEEVLKELEIPSLLDVFRYSLYFDKI